MSNVSHWKSSLAAQWQGPNLGGTVSASGSVVAGTAHLRGLNVTSVGTVAALSFTAGTVSGTALQVTGKLDVTGAGTVAGSVFAAGGVLTVAGPGTVSGTALYAAGELVTAGGLAVTNAGTISGTAIVGAGALKVTGAGTVSGTALVTGGELRATGAAYVGGKGTVVGDFTAAYVSDAGGTAYAVMTGLGTVYKVTGGTGVLTAGSLLVTPALKTMLTMTANYIVGGTAIGAVDVGTAIGTASPLTCVWDHATNAGGTAAIFSRDHAPAFGPAGTARVSWMALGLS